MKGLMPLFIGLFGTFTFSWIGLTLIPNLQIGALNPQMDEEQTDIYPMPQSGMVQQGRRIYAANGCIYCHSRQLRAGYVSTDLDRERDAGPSPRPKWGERRSAPRDYVFDRPVLLGEERMGPDLADLAKAAPSTEKSPGATPAANAPAASPAGAVQSPSGATNTASPKPGAPGTPPSATSPAAPGMAANPSTTPNPSGTPPAYSEAWHHRHLYSPRSMSEDTRDSNMPAYRFLYEKRRISGEPSSDALQLNGADALPPGWEVVPTYEAKCLVAYLMAQDQSHPLKEVKGAPGAAPAAARSPAASPAGSPAAAPPKK
jgi:cbb3-type cytochrome oxidase cytochrome c subunit